MEIKSYEYERITPEGARANCPFCKKECDAEDIVVAGMCVDCYYGEI